MDMVRKTALTGIISNIPFGACHFVLGLVSGSWWLLTLGIYYLMLGLVCIGTLAIREERHSVTKFAGRLLMMLSVTLVGVVVLSVLLEKGREFQLIMMLAIAVLIFTKITLATVNLVKSRRSESDRLLILRSIFFSDALVSVFALQRSMIASFEGMTHTETLVMNLLTGSAVSIAVFLIGLRLLKKQKRQTKI